MEIRKCRPEDLKSVIQLFRDTVQSVNSQDYSEEQTAIWSQSALQESWEKRLRKGATYVAVSAGMIVAFGVLNDEGWLDMLYAHRDFQKKGAGSAIVQALEEEAKVQGMEVIWTEASITAKSFFVSRGYEVRQKQQKVLAGTEFINYIMCKEL